MQRSEVLDRLYSTDHLLVAYNPKDEPIGFAGLELKSEKQAMYLSAAVVKPTEQGHGLYTTFTMQRIDIGLLFGFSVAVTRTQNPIIEYEIKRVLEMMVLEKEIKGYELLRRPAPGAYGRMLTKTIPKSKSEEINAIYGTLNYEMGDGYELTFKLSL